MPGMSASAQERKEQKEENKKMLMKQKAKQFKKDKHLSGEYLPKKSSPKKVETVSDLIARKYRETVAR